MERATTGRLRTRWLGSMLEVDGAELYVEVGGRRAARRARARARPLGRALEPRRDALGAGYTLVRVDLRGAGGSRELERDGALARALGRRPRGRARRARARAPDDRRALARRGIALKLALEQPELPARARAHRRRTPTSPTSRRACSPPPSGSRAMGSRAGWTEFWSKNPPFSRSPRSSATGDPRRVPRPAARERPRRLRPPVPRDRGRRAALRPARRGHAARARARRRDRRPHAARARPRAGRALAERPRSSSCPTSGHTLPLEAPQADGGAMRAFLRERRRGGRRRARRTCRRPPRRHDAAQREGGAVRPPRRPLGRRRAHRARR